MGNLMEKLVRASGKSKRRRKSEREEVGGGGEEEGHLKYGNKERRLRGLLPGFLRGAPGANGIIASRGRKKKIQRWENRNGAPLKEIP